MMRRLPAQLAATLALALALQGCDPCAGIEGLAQADCCADMPDVPSCKADDLAKDECSADNGSFASACAVAPDDAVLVDFSKPGKVSDEDYFVVSAGAEHRRMRPSLTTRDDAETRTSHRIELEVFDEAERSLLAMSAVTAYGDPAQLAPVGVRAGGTYYVLVRTFEAGGFVLDVGLDDVPYELEPNDSITQATVLRSDGEPMSGSVLSTTSATDQDYFSVSSQVDSQSVLVTLDNEGEAPLQLVILDAVERSVGLLVAEARQGSQTTVGLSSPQIFFFRVSSESFTQDASLAYLISADFRGGTFEVEPNDTFPNAQRIEPSTSVRGGYSQANGLTDDDVFFLVAPTDAKTMTIAGTGSDLFVVGAFGADEQPLETTGGVAGRTLTLQVPITGGEDVFVRIRATPDAAGEEYQIRVTFE